MGEKTSQQWQNVQVSSRKESTDKKHLRERRGVQKIIVKSFCVEKENLSTRSGPEWGGKKGSLTLNGIARNRVDLQIGEGEGKTERACWPKSLEVFNASGVSVEVPRAREDI